MKTRRSSIKPLMNWLKERILAKTFYVYDLAQIQALIQVRLDLIVLSRKRTLKKALV